MPDAGRDAIGRRLLLAGAGTMVLGRLGMAAARAEPGRPIHITLGPTSTVDAFLDSIGVGVHWEQRDGVYGRDRDTVMARIVALGVRHVRGFDQEMSPRLAQHGIAATLVAGPEVGIPAKILDMVRSANAAAPVIDAVEGPNEADLFWPMHGYRYKGEGFPKGLLAYQRDLFSVFKNSPDQHRVRIIGPSLGRTYDPGAGTANPLPNGSLTEAVDWGNFHPYPFGGNSFSTPFQYGGIERYYWNGNFPSDNLDEFPYALDVYGPPFVPRPMAATETGYPTWRDGVSESVQAIYLPRLFAEYFRLGIRRTYVYELADNRSDPTGEMMDDHFGLFRNDLTPKPAAIALSSLTKVLASHAQPNAPGPAPHLALTAWLPSGYDRPEYVHSLVLRASDRHSFLLVWHEVADADTSTNPPRTITVPDGTLHVMVERPYSVTGWFEYGSDWLLQYRAVSPSATLECPLQSRLIVILLSRITMGGA